MSRPEQNPSILLIDDGELDEVARRLEELGRPFTRLRGGDAGENIAPPLDLLVATPRRARSVRRGSPEGARPGKPLRIIAVEEDSTAMRRRLRRDGFHLLVRLPTHTEIWRLLIERALYHGDERREDPRVAVGSEVALDTGGGPGAAVLVDISNRGCRVLTADPTPTGEILEIAIPGAATGDAPLALQGKVRRTSQVATENGEIRHALAVVFSDMDDDLRGQLGAMINAWATGPSSMSSLAGLHGPALPPCASPTIPGLTLDDETDPAVCAAEAVPVRLSRPSRPDRRRQPRGSFASPVLAVGEGHNRVLMGCDLSPGGMRIAPHAELSVGDRFRLALYGPARPEPFLVSAEVIRDDREAGLALRFQDVSEDTAEVLEKLVACLPDVESLEDGEAAGLGAILSEIIDD